MKRAERQPLGDLHLYGDVLVKEMLTPDAGTIIPSHAHTYDHISYLAAGAVQVWRDGVDLGVFRAPAAVRIPARAKHHFMTLEPYTLVLCIHNAAHGEAADIHDENHLVTEEG